VYGGDESNYPSTEPDTLSYYYGYVLTIPGFQWFQIDGEGFSTAGRRSSHTCNLIGQRQVLVSGGYDPTLGGSELFKHADPWAQGLNVFDLTSLAWRNSFDPDVPPYEAPQVIREWYNKTSPNDVDWTSDRLRSLFQAHGKEWFPSDASDVPSDSPPNSPSNSSSPADPVGTDNSVNAGKIAGSVVGGILCLLLILGAVWIFFRHRRGLPLWKRKAARSTDENDPGTFGYKHELHGGPLVSQLDDSELIRWSAAQPHELDPQHNEEQDLISHELLRSEIVQLYREDDITRTVQEAPSKDQVDSSCRPVRLYELP
jgi:hypothetical protein